MGVSPPGAMLDIPNGPWWYDRTLELMNAEAEALALKQRRWRDQGRPRLTG